MMSIDGGGSLVPRGTSRRLELLYGCSKTVPVRLQQPTKKPEKCGILIRQSAMSSSEDSPEKQLQVGLSEIERYGGTCVKTYYEIDVSGSNRLAARPGPQELLRDVKAGLVDSVFIYAFDRLARRVSVAMDIYEQLQELQVGLYECGSGIIDPTAALLKSHMAAEDLKKFKRDMWDGHTRAAMAGLFPGPTPYGYDKVRGIRSAGTGRETRGVIAINRAEARLITWIHRAFAIQRWSVNEIVKVLTDKGVPGPRGGPWTAAKLLGQRDVVWGILGNPRFIGEGTWNLAERVNGANVPRRDKSSTATPKHPHQAFLPMDLFVKTWELLDEIYAAQDRRRAVREQGAASRKSVPPVEREQVELLLKDIVFCGCGEAMQVVQTSDAKSPGLPRRRRLGCPVCRAKSGAERGRTVSVDVVDDQIVGRVIDLLTDPCHVREYAQRYNQSLPAEIAKKKRRLERVEFDLKSLDEALTTRAAKAAFGAFSSERQMAASVRLEERYQALLAERATLRRLGSKLEVEDDHLARLSGAFGELRRYQPFIAETEAQKRLRDSFRGFVSRVELHQLERPLLQIRLHGRLAGFGVEADATDDKFGLSWRIDTRDAARHPAPVGGDGSHGAHPIR